MGRTLGPHRERVLDALFMVFAVMVGAAALAATVLWFLTQDKEAGPALKRWPRSRR